jgi:23S rRNA (cytosine1962-C5)-methyltransferase
MDGAAKALPPGTLATLHRVDGKPLGVGSFNPHTLIAFRLFDPDPGTVIDGGFFGRRLRRALALRERLFAEPHYRLVHAEADGLPGLVVDRFAGVFVLQLNTAGMAALATPLLSALDEVFAPDAVVLRNDSASRQMEGLALETAVAKGSLPDPMTVREQGLVFHADVLSGQKTGWFFDQRENRAFAGSLAAGGRVLDAFCHSGAFALTALARGAAQALGLDSSEAALALAQRSAETNGLAERCAFRRGEVFEELERLGSLGLRFDMVVADPPAFVKTKRDLPTGLKGYRKLARLSARLVEPGGFLLMASCSHNVPADAFHAEVVRGAVAADRTGRIIRTSGAAADHPVHLHLPETAYLKAVVLQLD